MIGRSTSDTSSQGWQFGALSGVGAIGFWSRAGGSCYYGGLSYDRNKWIHYVITLSITTPSNTTCTIYRNGVYGASGGLTTPTVSSNPLQVNHRPGTYPDSGSGIWDELSFFNRTLSPTDVSTLYNGGAGLAYDPDAAVYFGCTAYYSFNFSGSSYTSLVATVTNVGTRTVNTAVSNSPVANY
jgi:hypothetical protein